ncbi:uncharacterized protein [Hyperolius riggenbachi]|uniref:uncharacterized protein n=1 Tax=Hyperolius riggenbachi TaxID=752182 RepID=UPI0035A2A313
MTAAATSSRRERTSTSARLKKAEKTFIIKTMLEGRYDKGRREEKRIVLGQLSDGLRSRFNRTWSVKKLQTMWSDFKSKTPGAVRRIKRDIRRSRHHRRTARLQEPARSSSSPPSSANITPRTSPDRSPPTGDSAEPVETPAAADETAAAAETAAPPTAQKHRGRSRKRRRRSRSVASSLSVEHRHNLRRASRSTAGRSTSTTPVDRTGNVSERVGQFEVQVQGLTSTLALWKSEYESGMQQQRAEFENRLQQLEAQFNQHVANMVQQREAAEAEAEVQRQRVLQYRQEAQQLHESFSQLAGKRRM